MLQNLNLILHVFVFDKVMNIRNLVMALSDTDFEWEPRALAPDLKSLILSAIVLNFTSTKPRSENTR